MFIVASCVTSVALGDIYNDPTGDIATGNPNLDITQVEVTDDGSDLSITLTLDDLDADWGNYMIFMDLPGYLPNHMPGSPDNDNPWGRNVSGLAGTDYFVGSWLSGGGGHELYGYYTEPPGWGMPNQSTVQMSVDWDNDSITWNFTGWASELTAVGLEGINFEVGTTGGGWGDPAIDLLGGQGGNWGEGSTGAWSYYEFSTVPAPGVLALFALAGIGRRRRS